MFRPTAAVWRARGWVRGTRIYGSAVRQPELEGHLRRRESVELHRRARQEGAVGEAGRVRRLGRRASLRQESQSRQIAMPQQVTPDRHPDLFAEYVLQAALGQVCESCQVVDRRRRPWRRAQVLKYSGDTRVRRRVAIDIDAELRQ